MKARLPWQVGGRLWVKETWQTGSGFDGPQIAYRATGDCHDIAAWNGEDEGAVPSINYKRCPGAKWLTWLPDLLTRAEGIWRPSLFMPRWASRLKLLVTGVRVERRQDIPERVEAYVETCVLADIVALTQNGSTALDPLFATVLADVGAAAPRPRGAPAAHGA